MKGIPCPHDASSSLSSTGCGPTACNRHPPPCIDRLIREGASTYAARTVMPSATLPCHTSMLRGVPPQRHGITINTWVPQVRPVPSLVDVLHQAGKRTAFFYNWEQLRDLADCHAVYIEKADDLDGVVDAAIIKAVLTQLVDVRVEKGAQRHLVQQCAV